MIRNLLCEINSSNDGEGTEQAFFQVLQKLSEQRQASYHEVDHLVKHLGKRRHLKICRRPRKWLSPLQFSSQLSRHPIRALRVDTCSQG